MPIDVLTLVSGIISFLFFLSIHLITFRWVRPESLLQSLLWCVLAVLSLPILLMIFFSQARFVETTIFVWITAALLSMVIGGLLCLVYVWCIFGPYETSVRMRLIREIDHAQAEGISNQDLLKQYNDETVLKVRLQRLLGSGDIIEKDGRYKMGRSQNFFFIFDAVAGVLKKWINQ